MNRRTFLATRAMLRLSPLFFVAASLAGRSGGAARGYYEARNKILLQNGWNHAEIRLGTLRTASYDRDLSIDRIRGSTLFAERAAFPLTVYLDSLRLVSGKEPQETISRMQPEDTVTIINDRFFTVRQVARPEDVPEATDAAVPFSCFSPNWGIK